MSASPLLDVRDLSVSFKTLSGTMVHAVREVCLSICPAEVLALVGESGSGKSSVALALLGLLDAAEVRGEIAFSGIAPFNLENARHSEFHAIRGTYAAYIPQDALAAFDPRMRVGDHIVEALRSNGRISRAGAHARAVELLGSLGFENPVARSRDYPHQLSGGMRQRALIAAAIANRPRLIVADEPTTALDAILQRRVFEAFFRHRDETGCAVLLLTHDLPLAATVADRVGVLYQGRLVECGPSASVLRTPLHPYTRYLLNSRITGAKLHSSAVTASHDTATVAAHD